MISSAMPTSRFLLVPLHRPAAEPVRRFRLARLELNRRPDTRPGHDHLKRVYD